jgi:hypothetical protein
MENTTIATKTWNFKVVKKMRGTDGKWFDFPASGTFADFDQADEYASSFCSEQQASGVTNARFAVLPRRKNESRSAEYRISGEGHVSGGRAASV